tara:strand:+ start:1498 stop:1755 length:258 start_codon:yes stop_codon:yes gene_type:complete
MAIIANTFTSFDAKGIREDLSNVIYDIAPEEVPLQSNISQSEVSNTLFEWQTDTLMYMSLSLEIMIAKFRELLGTPLGTISSEVQ